MTQRLAFLLGADEINWCRLFDCRLIAFQKSFNHDARSSTRRQSTENMLHDIFSSRSTSGVSSPTDELTLNAKKVLTIRLCFKLRRFGIPLGRHFCWQNMPTTDKIRKNSLRPGHGSCYIVCQFDPSRFVDERDEFTKSHSKNYTIQFNSIQTDGKVQDPTIRSLFQE